MNLDNLKDRIIIVKDLEDYATSIINQMTNDSDTDANDWGKILRFREKIFALFDFMLVEHRFGYALYEMNGMKQSDEDSKWTFPLEKVFNEFLKEVVLSGIDGLIDCSRSWSFKDYRGRNFQNELRQKMTMLRDWYTEEYDSEDDDE